MQKYNLQDIEGTFKEKSWWAMLVSLLPSKYITYVIANYTELTPNQVTLISFLFAVFAGVSFYYQAFVLGAILYQISYIFDIVDGSLARVKRVSTKTGAFFDVFTDWIKALLLIAVLLYRTNEFVILVILFILLIWNCNANKYNDMLYYTTRKSFSKTDEIIESKIGKYFNYMRKKNVIALPGIVEFEALVLFLYPITHWTLCLYLAIGLLVFSFVLKTYVILKKIR